MRQKRRRPEKPKVRRSLELQITELGAQGDGIASGPDGPVYVPRSVVGDEGTAEVVGNRATSFARTVDGPDRRDAPCPHFEECGGCPLQHLSEEAYRTHKISVFERTFRTAGLELPPVTVVWGQNASRRRTTFRARGRGKGAILGYQKAGSHQLTPIDQCLILTKGLGEALPSIRQLASSILEPGDEATLAVSEYQNGLDISITLEPDLYEERRFKILAELGATAEAFNVSRITINGEPALVVRAPTISFGGVTVAPPHDAFLQPGVKSEEVLRNLVIENRPMIEGGRAVDLFSGCGTFSLPLAQYFDVVAYESETPQVLALELAAKTASLMNVKTIRRDLTREPLGDLELRKIDYAVLNPPRAGAKTQVEELAKSKVSAITYISCNPGTLARDAAILCGGGYVMTSMTLLDQFVYSAHSECVATFMRPAA